jgi:CRP-like cAMP-binding protein
MAKRSPRPKSGLGSAGVNRRGSNHLLSLLAPAERERMLALCERLPLELGAPIYAQGERIHHLYFPLSGVISLVLGMKDGSSIEVGVVGNEGFVGSQVALGSGQSDTRAVVQHAGDVLRIEADDFRRAMRRKNGLASIIHRSVQALMTQTSQSVLCNRVHGVEQRTCRWMLMAHDRVGTDVMQLTQQFIAEMLGIRRASVTFAAQELQQKGVITYSRGKVTVVDRAGLEAQACECYSIVARETERLLQS